MTARAPEPKRQREAVDILVGAKPADDRDHMNFFGDYTPEDLNESYADAGFANWDPRPIPSGEQPTGLGKPAGQGRYRAKRLQFKAEVDADGTVHFQDVPSFQAKLLPCIWSKKELRRCAERLEFPILRGQFDLTDWAERMVGNDPYRYEKHKYLEATRPEREKMARELLRELLREAVIAAPGLLRELWADESLTTAERRRLLFELWDECAEEGDDDIVVAARAFRGTVLAFVRRVLPAGSPHAFSAEELEALNRARTSTQRFDPYGEP
jgi:hypothetical protein